MISFIADENFNADIVRGLLRRDSTLDIVTVQQVGLSGADDPTVLDWAARNNRLILTHDVQTLPGFAYHRVRGQRPMPGVIEVPAQLMVGRAVDDILVIASASSPEDWEGQIIFLPL